MAAGEPGPVLARLFRLPVLVYRLRGGWLLGHRFLLLTHVGRRTGTRHQTVLEVVQYNPASSEAVVMSGFGRSAQWLKNLEAGRAAHVTIGRRSFDARYRRLDANEAMIAFAEYERRNRWARPIVHRVLSWLLGWHYSGSPTDLSKLVDQLPLIVLSPEVK
ncbi:MAG: nitroreductase family deazaflavin-dependent oxidoreductase [Acidimicrobiales bacterium]